MVEQENSVGEARLRSKEHHPVSASTHSEPLALEAGGRPMGQMPNGKAWQSLM